MLTEKESILLKYLRKNSRQSLSKVSKETKIPVSTLFDTLRKLEAKAITKHVSLIDFSKINYGIKIHFAIKAKNKKQIKEFLMNHTNVNTLSTLINGHDFYAEAIFSTMKDMIDFKEHLESIGTDEIAETFIVDEVKKEGFCL